MKRFLYIAILSTLYLSACTGTSTDDHEHSHEEGMHSHEDGTMHADHENHEQEEFSVSDSTLHEPMHENGEVHDH